MFSIIFTLVDHIIWFYLSGRFLSQWSTRFVVWDINPFNLRKDISSALILQVQFDEREDTKVCTIIINDDEVFENIESLTVELSMPVYALLGQVTRAKVNINDTEDEPTLQFDKKNYHINESNGFIFVPIERKGAQSCFALWFVLCII